MASITFDTLKFVEKLKAAGVSEPQAKAMADVQRDVLTETLDMTLATKTDVLEVKTEVDFLRRDMEILRADLKRDIAETKAELIRWVVAVGMLQIALIAALLLRLLPG